MTEQPPNNLDKKESNDSPYSSLTGSFGHVELQSKEHFYTIKDAEPLLNKMKAMLRESENGARLLDLADENKVKFHFIKSKKLQSATTPSLDIFLAAEPDQTEPYMTQILELGGALREIEQSLMGIKIPPPDADPLERANKAHTKFLDKIAYMCKIGIDLENVYSDEVKKAIKAFGYEDLYNVQVNALGEEKAREIYFKALKEAK